MPEPMLVANAGRSELALLPGLANRHGLIAATTGPRGVHHDGVLESAAKSAARAIGSQLGREIVRGVLGSILGGGKRR